LPATIQSDGTLYWYKNGLLHRDDLDENGRILPAAIDREGPRWYINNERVSN